MISIFEQMNITNPTSCLVKFDILSCYIHLLYSPTGEYNKTEIYKMAASRFGKATDKEISEIKINSVPKTQKTCVKILKQLFASGSVIIGD
jgi:hypothetical protein